MCFIRVRSLEAEGLVGGENGQGKGGGKRGVEGGMKPHRLKLTHNLILAYGLYRKMECFVRSVLRGCAKFGARR